MLTEHRHAQRARELLDELDPMRAAQEKLRRNQEQARAEQERMDRERMDRERMERERTDRG